VNNLNHFVVVVVHVKQLTDGADHVVMMKKITIRMKIQQRLQMVQLHGHLEVDQQDEAVVAVVVEMDHWNIERNQMINGIIMMIDLVQKKK
jgi:hypothetical protein